MKRAQGTGRVVAIGIAMAWAMLVPSQRAFALNPALDISQYAHTAWKIREGFAKGRITDVAQTPDGYLWLGTDFGLLRFDGVRNVPWQPPSGQSLPSNEVHSLRVGRDGTLWIGTKRGLAGWKNGKLLLYPQLAGASVLPLLEDHEGSLWVGVIGFPNGKLCAVRGADVRCDGGDGSLGLGVQGLHEDVDGNLWVAAADGLWRWKPGAPQFYPLPDEVNGIRGFDRDENGALLVGGTTGLRHLVEGTFQAYRLPGSVQPTHIDTMLRDRDGGLWVGTTTNGLVHVHQGRADVFTMTDGLSSDIVWRLFEDREGNIWVATSDGLDRFRDVAVRTVSVRQGLASTVANSLLTTRDASVVIATTRGMNQWSGAGVTIAQTGTGTRDGRIDGNAPNCLLEDHLGRLWMSTRDGVGYREHDRLVRIPGVPATAVHSMAEDSEGTVWIADQNRGLFGLSGERLADQFSWNQLGRSDFVNVVAADRSRGGLWLGFYESGLAYFANGAIRESYRVADGLTEGRISDIRVDQDGTVWASSDGGLSRVKDGRVTTLTSANGLPCDSVNWALEDNDHALWLTLRCGLARISRDELDAWETASRAGQFASRRVAVTVFDSFDGFRSTVAGGYSPHAAKSADGELWFKADDGVSVIDPRRLLMNRLPPPVVIEQVAADRRVYDVPAAAAGAMRLPPLTRDLAIDYTALSLVAPEKNQFRVRLEGWDRDWQDVGNRRQAVYNNLPPRTYRFRVLASNNSGVWNEAGAALDFSIAPAYYQTIWFRTAAALAVFALLWAAYQYRLRQVAYEFDARLQERVNERTRIARELHDTLLQSFHGLLFRFQAATNRLPDSDIKKQFESAIDQAAQAITEGRDAVQNLRASTAVTNDLAEAIGTLGNELAASHVDGASATPAVVNVSVEGTPRNLHPILRDDIYRIAGEALRNAFRHASARHIEVEIRYDAAQLQVRVRDDGKGIDPQMLDEPRDGHFGLPGMRERAGLIGGRLEVWSKPGLGTEVELTIPGAAVYATPRARSRPWWSPRRTGTDV